jgi:hypothetical protein
VLSYSEPSANTYRIVDPKVRYDNHTFMGATAHVTDRFFLAGYHTGEGKMLPVSSSPEETIAVSSSDHVSVWEVDQNFSPYAWMVSTVRAKFSEQGDWLVWLKTDSF